MAISTRPPTTDDDFCDGDELPAAVVCAHCGLSECVSTHTPEPAPRGTVPWEQGGGATWQRLWRTAHETSDNGEAFFGSLQDGGVARPLLFALACEALAIGSLAAIWLALAFAVAPDLLDSALESERRWTVLLAVLLSVPILSVLMVVLHIVWGTAMELGVRIHGERPRFSHVLRYALYSCGWDLLTSPIGVAAASLARGPRLALRSSRAAMIVPRRATRAYLLQARKLSDDGARTAVWTAAIATGTLVVAGAVTFIGVAVALLAYA